jgi:hypothetical protein
MIYVPATSFVHRNVKNVKLAFQLSRSRALVFWSTRAALLGKVAVKAAPSLTGLAGAACATVAPITVLPLPEAPPGPSAGVRHGAPRPPAAIEGPCAQRPPGGRARHAPRACLPSPRPESEPPGGPSPGARRPLPVRADADWGSFLCPSRHWHTAALRIDGPDCALCAAASSSSELTAPSLLQQLEVSLLNISA